MTDMLVDDLVECLELLGIVPTDHLAELAHATAVAAARPSCSPVEVLERLTRATRLLAACMAVRNRIFLAAQAPESAK